MAVSSNREALVETGWGAHRAVAMQAELEVLRPGRLNIETELSGLVGVLTPTADFFVRSHFEPPALDASSWRLEVGGLVDRSLRLSLREIWNLPSQTLVATLECAGNGRSLLNPPAPGEQWGLGAVSTAEWTGVPLVGVLDLAGIKPNAREVVFRGADRGPVDGRPGRIRFERSLSLDHALNPEVLLAYAMNGEALPLQHGFPVRVVVPGWYGVASVKWLTHIEVSATRFAGYFQTERYVFVGEGQQRREPVNLQRVRAIITEPGQDEEVAAGDLVVRGVAWSGAAPIARVEVSLRRGPWRAARLLGQPTRFGWRRWELITRADWRGSCSIRARATDCGGRTQPDRPEWNRLGYGVNAVHEVHAHRSA
jgi:DMSO/TMAO reductase YedYZ molybdopterin-dependent catalytic subunit